MWYLIEEDPLQRPAPKYWLGGVAGGGRTIGRKHVDIRLKISSVSRTHAKITVQKAAFYTPTGADVRRRYQSTSVSVHDSSAYGTFLKYPPGHASNRGENVVGHHRRLDKDSPTDVREGALLAFGAPSSWWRVGWLPVVLYPSRLSDKQLARLAEIANVTSLEIANHWPQEVTHFVTNQCVASNVKFLAALVQGKPIVTTAWVETVYHTVSNACRSIAEAPNETVAATIPSLAEERHYAPPFSPPDEAQFSPELLSTVFEPARKERRQTLLTSIAIAFSQDDRRAKWAALIDALGGTAILAKAAASQPDNTRVIYVHNETPGSKKREHQPANVQGAQAVSLTALIEAILRADLAPLEATVNEPNEAEVAEVATPGPLEVDSGAESGESEPVVDEDSCHEDDLKGNEDTPSSIPARTPKVWKKRVRGTAAETSSNDPDGKRPRLDTGEHAQGDQATVETLQEIVVENSDINPVSYFRAPGPALPSSFSVTNDGDVRPFRRRNVLESTRIKSQKVRYVPLAEATESRSNGDSEEKN